METTKKEVGAVSESVATTADVDASTQKTHHVKRFQRTSRMNKKAMITLAVAVIVLGILYAARALLVAVTVNGSPISRWSVIRELEKKSGEQALDTMVTKRLIADAAKKAGIVVSTADVDKEVASVTEQVTKQGGTLALALAQQGMTEADFRDQVVLQKELERILGDAVKVTDDDVAQYIAQSKATAPKGTSDDDFKAQVREQLKGQKFNMAASKWVMDTKAKAQLTYYVDYAPAKVPEVTPAPSDTTSSAPVSNDAPAADTQAKK